jgi:hypothetical protein
VSASRQRLGYWKFIWLPVFVAIVVLAAAKLIALQRADIVSQLADHVAHRDSPEAAAAVRQLASIPGAPVSILVSAAASPDRNVAEEGKLCISRMLRRAQRQIDDGRRVGAIARQLAELAEALDAEQSRFSKSDDAWLSSTARKLVRLANRVPRQQTPLVAVHCDAILARIRGHEPEVAKIAEVIATERPPLVVEESAVDTSAEVPMGATGNGPQSAVMSLGLAPASRPLRSVANGEPASVASRQSPARTQGEENASAETTVEHWLQAPWRASWSHPIFRMAPARPIREPAAEQAAPSESPSAAPAALPAEQAAKPPLAEVESRQLLQRWLAADGSDVVSLEEELTRRGFGRLSERLAEQLFSAHAADRLAIVDDVLQEPGVDARPWLVLLADDADADVRLLAVTIMATSNDAALVDKALEISIRDSDPRIAKLAGRLRDRREGAQRQ